MYSDSLFGRLLGHLDKNLLKDRIFLLLRVYVRLELLIVLVYLRRAILLYVLNFLNEALHEDIGFVSECLSLLLESCQ